MILGAKKSSAKPQMENQCWAFIQSNNCMLMLKEKQKINLKKKKPFRF